MFKNYQYKKGYYYKYEFKTNGTLKFKIATFNNEWKNNKIEGNETFTYNNNSEKYVDSKKRIYILF